MVEGREPLFSLIEDGMLRKFLIGCWKTSKVMFVLLMLVALFGMGVWGIFQIFVYFGQDFVVYIAVSFMIMSIIAIILAGGFFNMIGMFDRDEEEE